LAEDDAQLPAGWYDDGETPDVVRWWDGVGWTEHTLFGGESGDRARPLLPSELAVYGPFIWVITLLPVVSWLRYFLPDPGYRVDGFISLIFGAATIVLAHRDREWLIGQGVMRPFHWAWSFLSSPVYVIGRSVIVRRVAAPEGLAPMWVAIGILLLGLVNVTVWVLTEIQ
jgi:hypothetical protein